GSLRSSDRRSAARRSLRRSAVLDLPDRRPQRVDPLVEPTLGVDAAVGVEAREHAAHLVADSGAEHGLAHLFRVARDGLDGAGGGNVDERHAREVEDQHLGAVLAGALSPVMSDVRSGAEDTRTTALDPTDSDLGAV